MVTLARGVAAYLEGRWQVAQEECDRAETVFRDRCTGVAWELNTANAFSLWAMSHQGELAELSHRWPLLLTQARERGNLYAAMNLSSYLMSVVRLAADDPDTASSELAETTSKWSREGYHVQHNDALWAAVQIELYCGKGLEAWNLIRRAWPALRGSLLMRVQFIRTSMRFLRARAALSAAVELGKSRRGERHSLLAIAGHDARQLEREHMPCPDSFARMIRGVLAAIRGDSTRTIGLLEDTVRRFEAVDMQLCASAVKLRIGELRGGEAGHKEILQAKDWMSQQKIQSPSNMAAMILPALKR
jgi:hypothetical protein